MNYAASRPAASGRFANGRHIAASNTKADPAAIRRATVDDIVAGVPRWAASASAVRYLRHTQTTSQRSWPGNPSNRAGVA